MKSYIWLYKHIRKIFVGSIAVMVLLVLGIYQFFTAQALDMAYERSRVAMDFIYDRCHCYDDYLALSHIKSYRSVLEKNMFFQRHIPPAMLTDGESLRLLAREQSLTGILVVDAQGRLVAQSEPNGYFIMQKLLRLPGVQDVAGYPQKSYVGTAQPGSVEYAMAVSARLDAPGYIVSYMPLHAENVKCVPLDNFIGAYQLNLPGAVVIMAENQSLYQSQDYPASARTSDGLTLVRALQEKMEPGEKLTEIETASDGVWYGRMTHYKKYQCYILYRKDAVFAQRQGAVRLTIVVLVVILVLAGLLLELMRQRHKAELADMEQELLAKGQAKAPPGKVYTRSAQEGYSEVSYKPPQPANLIKVLLAEDNELNMEIAEFILQTQGMRVVRAFNGEEAVDIFAASEPGEIALVLMDIRMPVLNGFEAANTIRHMDRSDADVPIIALTASPEEEIREELKAAGIDYCINKPLNASKLKNTISEYVKADVE